MQVYLLSQRVPLGIIMKNENKVMVCIMSTLQQYVLIRQLSGSVAVPGSSDLEFTDVELLHKILLGGDSCEGQRQWRSYTRAHTGLGPGEFLRALVNHLRSTYLNPVALPGMGMVGPCPTTRKSSVRYNSSLFQVAI